MPENIGGSLLRSDPLARKTWSSEYAKLELRMFT